MLNDCVTVHNKKAPKYAEIFKLAANYWITKDNAVVAQGTGTKGFEDGLLEITGLLYPEEAERSEDGSLGWLTADNVLERILKKEAEKNG